MKRKDLVQKIIDKINANSYLEIGLGNGYVFNSVTCNRKVGVDPAFNTHENGSPCTIKPTFKMTSDDFFATNNETFDVVFIDGLHKADQVQKDIDNALKFLNDGGYIICHDVSPKSLEAQLVPRVQKEWNGDCWKAWVRLKSTRKDLIMYAVDTDYGCGVIQKGNQTLLDLQGLEIIYENLVKNREEWLNLISVSEFEVKINSNPSSNCPQPTMAVN